MKPHAVLVPTYNSAATIGETLQSLLAQDLSPVDAVYLADDGSADSTLEIARRIWQSDIPLIVLEQERNQGQWRNVNEAMLRMPDHLEWIYILHSDDVAKSRWLTAMVQQIERADPMVGTVCSSWDNLNGDGSVVVGEDEPGRPAVHVDGSAEAIRSTLLKGCWWHISGCAIRLQAFRDVGEFAEHLAQSSDWAWLLRCLRRGWGVDYVPQTLIVYRQHSASVSSASFRDHRDVVEAFEIIQSFAGYLTLRDVGQLHAARARALISRLGRSLLNKNIDRARKALVLLLQIPARFGGTLASRRALEAGVTGRHSR
jgi:glycosyltransferase involved in cell wall biosynthesis